jgi:hypothetical protein
MRVRRQPLAEASLRLSTVILWDTGVAVIDVLFIAGL